MKDIKKLATEIYNECLAEGEPVSMEEATEMAKAEIGAKDIKDYVDTEKTKNRGKGKPHVIKVSDEKKELFNTILNGLLNSNIKFSNLINVKKENKLIEVSINDKIFKIDIIEQRPPKKTP